MIIIYNDFKLIARFLLSPVGCTSHSVTLRMTCHWKGKSVPRKNHGSPINPDPLALGGLGLSPQGLSLAQLGKLDVSTGEQLGMRNICWVKGQEQHWQFQEKKKEKRKGLSHNLLMMINEANGKYPTDLSRTPA